MSFSSQFIEVLDALCDKIGIAIDWTSQDVVPYVTDLAARIIAYEISTNVAWIVIAAIVFLIVWKMTKRDCKADAFDEEWLLGWAIRIVAGILCFIAISCQVFDIIEAVALPEKTLYVFITRLMRNGT